MQIITIALFAGIGIAAIGERGNNLRILIDEWSVLMRTIVSIICGFIPLFVFVMLLSQIWHGNTEILLSVLKPLVITVVIVLIMAVLFWLLTSVIVKCPPMRLLKKLIPHSLVAFSTASSMAAMSLGLENCEKKLGVKHEVVSFAYPIGTVVFMPASIVSFNSFVYVTRCTFV